MARKIKPRWWLLYLTVPLMIGLLLLEGHLPEPPVVHQVLETGIVVVCFGLMALWVHANQAALENEQFEKEGWRLKFHRNAEGIRQAHHLPHVDAGEDTEQDPYHLESGPTKGRFN